MPSDVVWVFNFAGARESRRLQCSLTPFLVLCAIPFRKEASCNQRSPFGRDDSLETILMCELVQVMSWSSYGLRISVSVYAR